MAILKVPQGTPRAEGVDPQFMLMAGAMMYEERQRQIEALDEKGEEPSK